MNDSQVVGSIHFEGQGKKVRVVCLINVDGAKHSAGNLDREDDNEDAEEPTIQAGQMIMKPAKFVHEITP